MFTCLVLLALFASTQGRAVNISNTWVLPEEGFPVFYRYFRDRISWYEADAVCQFHHANLVTVDTTAQYDAVRAYLKELDISSAVWVGLIRSNPDGDFTWTDYRGLSSDGYWSSAPDARSAPLCAAADPAADYRWEARACGGPTVASFICELPVPQWALGKEGCMVRAIPALTVLYLPESAAVQLTADCGLAGVKRVQCTGNVKHGELLKELSCNDEEELTSTPVISSEETTTSESINITDLEVVSESTTEEDIITTKNNIEETKLPTTLETLSPISIKENLPTRQQTKINKLNNIFSQKNINLDLFHNNNLQSNDIPKLANNNENFLTIEQTEKLEDEKHMHHKMLHDELARHGNFETIFSQPTDHFVPPLVMAKAKLSDDMTVLSLAEKHAQKLAEQRLAKHNMMYEHEIKPATEEPHKIEMIDKPLVITMQPINKDSIKKDKIKAGMPKKYKEKYEDPKGRLKLDGKLLKFDKLIDKSSTYIDASNKLSELTTLAPMKITTGNKLRDDSMELTVILKEPDVSKITSAKEDNKDQPLLEPIFTTEKTITEPSTTTETINNDFTPIQQIITNNEKTMNVIESSTSHVRTTSTEEAATLALDKFQTIAMQDIALNHEIIKITIVKDGDDVNPTHTVFEVTTLMPEFKDDNIKIRNKPQLVETTKYDTTTTKEVTTSSNMDTISINTTVSKQPTHTETVTLTTSTLPLKVITTSTALPEKIDTTFAPIVTSKTPITPTITSTSVSNTTQINDVKIIEDHSSEASTTTNIISTTDKEVVEVVNITELLDGGLEKNGTDPYAIDDTNSPLLSGANEPLHRPNRMRRPQQPNKVAKFNPFRILG